MGLSLQEYNSPQGQVIKISLSDDHTKLETKYLQYPSAKLLEIMEITAVNEDKDQFEGYEIVIKTSEKEQIEVTLAPDGKILEEDTGD